MSTRFVRFDSTDRVTAEVYEAECTIQLQVMSQGAETRWYIPRQDVGGAWIVALYGPPWVYGGVTVAEPATCAELRGDTPLIAAPQWPEED